MAKVSNKRTTSSRKTAGSVSSNKNSKGLFGKSFNLQSRKVQFFVVIAIVALLGGGWFTYRSFAATTNFTSFIGAETGKVNNGGNKNGEITSVLKPGYTYASSDVVRISRTGYYAVCVMSWANDSNSSTNVEARLFHSATRKEHFKSTIPLINNSKASSAVSGSDFWKNCTNQNVQLTANTPLRLELKANNNKGGVYILYAFLEEREGPTQQISK